MESLVAGRRSWLVIVGLAGLLAAGAVPGIDVVLERLLWILSTGVAIVGLWPIRSADQWCTRIARAARGDARRSLQDTGTYASDPEPAGLAFRAPSEEAEPELVRWGVAGCAGQINELPGIIRAHPGHQVVVLGDGGAGKTTTGQLSTESLNDALLAGDADSAFTHVKAVIYVNVAGWTRSAEWLRSARPQDVADALDSWLARQLVQRHRTPWILAHRLVGDGEVMPVLDGVDEMDPPDSPGQPRAAALIRAMNYLGRPVVLLCRTATYRQLCAGDRIHGEPPVAQAALHVVLKDLTPEWIHDYLVRRFPDGTGLEPRWRPVAEAIRPGSEHHQPALALALSRPWYLFLAVTAYLDPETQPTELLRTPPERLDDLLMRRFVEAAVLRHPRLRRYNRRHGQRVLHYLSMLARLLHRTGDPRGRFRWSPTGLYLDDVWPIGGWYAPRYLPFAVKAVVAAIPAAFTLTVGARLGLLSLPVVALLIVATAPGIVLALLTERYPHPRPLERSDARIHDRRSWFFDRLLGGRAGGLIYGVITAVVAGSAVGLLQGPENAVTAGLLIGLAGGLAGGFVYHVGGVRTVSRPSSLLRKSIASELAATLPLWIILFVGVFTWLVVTAGWPLGPALAAIGIGAAGGIGFGSANFLLATRWLRYWIAVAIAASRRDLPWRPAAFLDAAYEAGLVRLSGIAVEFRHPDFQQWLVAWPEQGAIARGDTGGGGAHPVIPAGGQPRPATGPGVRSGEVRSVKVGVPREVKNHEYRVAITPAGAHEFVRAGHEVWIETGAGLGSSITDQEYLAAGARIVPTAEEVWGGAELVLKVKEPVPEEYHLLRGGQVLFTYLHLAASKECTDALLEREVTAVAYETVATPDGRLPLLAPMSEVAGRLAPQVGAYHLMRSGGGRGVLMGGVSGVYAAKVVVIGAGVSGMNSAAVALGMQAEVLLLDKNIDKLRQADAIYQGHLQTVASNAYEVEKAVLDADLVIGAVLVPGAKAPTLVNDALVARMKPGSVLVDISIDQGGCFESSRPTTHADPVYPVHESLFYCVTNMPGAVPHTSTYALTNVTVPYALELANHGWREAMRRDRALAAGLNSHAGALTNAAVAAAHGLPSVPLPEVLR